MNWTLIARTLNESPHWFWALLLTFLGALYSIGSDHPNLWLKLRALVYGTLFGYFVARPCTNWLPEIWRETGYLAGGASGVLLAEILLTALKQAKDDPARLLLFIWQEIKQAIPVSDLLARFKIPTKKPS